MPTLAPADLRRYLILLPMLGCRAPEAPASPLERGIASYEAGRFAEAEEAYRQALALDSHDARLHDLHGEALLELGRHEEALAACRRSLKRDPDNAWAHGHAGQALRALGRRAAARTHFQRALSLEPGNEHFLRCLESVQRQP